MEHVLNSISVTEIVYLPRETIWGLWTNEEDSLQTNDDSKKDLISLRLLWQNKNKGVCLLEANHEPLMGNKMLRQTSIKGCCPSLASLESWHWVPQNKIKKLKLGETLRHKRDTMNPGLWSWLQNHFADCSPSVPEQEDRPLCCRRLVPPISLFQQFFTGDGSLKVLLPPGLAPVIDANLLFQWSAANAGYHLTYF